LDVSQFAYNVITGQLDLVGGGASYIDGVVADSSLLPVTLGTPALDSVYLAKAGSGVWLINRRPAGLYCRVANNGNLDDWQFLSAFPEVNADANWALYSSADPSKELKFDLSGLPTSTVRTVSAPAGNGQMLVEGQAIGTTTPAAGSFTALDATTTTIPDGTRSALPFRFASNTDLGFYRRGNNTITFVSQGLNRVEITGNQLKLEVNQSLNWVFNDLTGSPDLSLLRDAGDTLAQRRATAAQTFNIYNTFTSATNHERGFLRWSSNVFQIGTEAGSGGGTVRNVDIRVGTQSSGAVFSASGSGMQLSLRNVTTTSTSSLAGITLGSGSDIALSTTTGTKIGTATNQLLGFYNATPVAQQAAVADATDAASTQDRLNDLLARLRTLGLIAT